MTDNTENRLIQMCIQDWGSTNNNATFNPAQIQGGMFTQLKNSTTFRCQFKAAPDDTTRLALCLAHSSYKRLCCQIDQYQREFSSTGFGCKMATHAAGYRQAGNEDYRAQEYLKAAGKYTRAIQYAPAVVSGDHTVLVELPLGYNNRSVVYFALKQYQFALDDINAALAHGYARYRPLFAILARKCECLAHLGRSGEAKTVGTEELRSDQKSDRDRLQQLDQLIKQSKAQPEESAPPASTIDLLGSRFTAQKKYGGQLSKKVAIKAHKSSPNGRRLVAVEEITFGEVLALSSPYASVLAPDFDGDYCHHCCRELFSDPTNILRPIHCPDCSTVLFCSEQCRMRSWNTYHRFECIHKFILYPSTSTDRLAFRLFLMHQPDEILQVQRGGAGSVDYSHIHQMMTGTGQVAESYEGLLKKIINVCFFLYLLKSGGYFASAPEQCTESWAGDILLRLMRQVACNSRMINVGAATTTTTRRPLPDAADVPHHIEICPTFALLNHSCAPNGHLVKIPNQRDSVIQAMRFIEPGEEVTITVNDITAEKILSLKERQVKIREKSGFGCRCARCNLEQKDMPKKAKCYHALACEACDGLIEKDADSKSFHCTDCYLQLSPAECKWRHTKADRLITEFTSLLSSSASKPDKSKQIHIEKIYFQAKSLLHASSYQLVTLCSRIAHCYLNLALPVKAADYAEEHLQLADTCFGEDSLKMLEVLEDYGGQFKQMMMMMDSPEGEKVKKTRQLEVIKRQLKEMEVRRQKLKQMYEL